MLLSLAATQWLVGTWKDLPSAQSIHADGVVLAFACAIVVACGPAGRPVAVRSHRQARERSQLCRLRRGAQQAASRARRLRKTLLTMEIATTVVLLIAAGLLLKSFWRLRTTDVGCVTDNVLTMSYSLPAEKYDSPEKVNAFNETLLERVRAMPGVRGAALGSRVPGAGPGEDDDFTIPEHPPIAPGSSLPDALYRTADPGYFSALQIPLLSGRFFTSADRVGHPKTIIDQPPVGAAVFPRGESTGQASHVAARGDADYEIVGVVADTLYQVGQRGSATMYFPVLNGRESMGA